LNSSLKLRLARRVFVWFAILATVSAFRWVSTKADQAQSERIRNGGGIVPLANVLEPESINQPDCAETELSHEHILPRRAQH
jgi:hypothetical protein